MKEEWLEKFKTYKRRLQTLEDLHENNGYEVLKRTTARQKCMERKY